MDEFQAWLTLARAPGLHSGVLAPLLQRFRSPVAILAAPPAELHEHGASRAFVRWVREHETVDLSADLRWLEHPGRRFIPWGDAEYPPLLAEIPDAPVGLYVQGAPSVLLLPQLAIVGSRNPSPAGRENAAHLAAELAGCGLVVTSGLALGIDAASHRGALDARGATIAVCGAGLDVIYPRSHVELAAQICESGAIISEFPIGSPPIKPNFPRRNRIISGLALGTLVIEAAMQSGSLITARLAAEQGREVFALPGSIHNGLARGCHQLIRQGAKLVESAADIVVELRAISGALRVPAGLSSMPEARRNCPGVLDKEYEILLDALGFEPASVDALIARTGLKADAVASMLLILELEGRIESHPGGLYVQRARA
jgi:DNA processing protein